MLEIAAVSKGALVKKLSLVLLLACTLTAFGAEKRALVLDDLYRLKSLGELALSPDGKRVAFTVVSSDFRRGKQTQAIWLMNVDGSDLRQATTGEYIDSSPLFSPDGKMLAFISGRSGSDQIYLLPLDGGEPKKLSDVHTSISGLLWSPDGRFIVFASSVYPECGADSACNKDIADTWGEGPLTAHMADALLYRHWNVWKDGKEDHILATDMEGKVRDLTPGPHESPVFSLGGDRNYDISPDGKWLVFASKRVADPAESTNADLFLQNLSEKITPDSARNLTAANEAWDGSPRFSPDGKTIAYLSQRVPTFESDLVRIAVVDPATGEAKLLTDRNTFDNWANEVRWTSDGNAVHFTAQERGETPLYRFMPKAGKFDRLVAHANFDAWVLDSSGKFALAIRRSVGEPAEVWRYDLAVKGAPKRLTFFNKQVEDEVDIRPAERLSIPGADGKPVEVFLVKPHGFDPAKKYPLILNVHGGPQQQWMDSFRGDWQVYPGAGYIVAMPNPHGSNGYGQDYCDAISGDWGGKVFEDLMKVTEYLANLSFVDKSRMGAMGWSYGGYMMNWIEGHENPFKCLASMMGAFNLSSKYGATEELWFPQWDLKGTPWDSDDYKKWNPANHVQNFKTPMLVISGEKDYRIAYTESLQMFTALQKMKVPSRLVIFPKAGHWPSWYEMSFYYLVHLDWFHKYLGGAPAPYDVQEFLRNRVFKEK
jgi:dipeptidyl aminopeptidase/acylaminoacyl peptidase